MGFSVEIDLPRRLLNMSYIQDVGPEEASCCVEEVRTLLADLQPGFRLLTDFTQLESMEASCSLYMEQIMDLCDQQGVAMVVSIVSDPHKDIGFNIMSIFHYARDVPIVTCSSLKEAEKALED
jgi:hypothetical protein